MSIIDFFNKYNSCVICGLPLQKGITLVIDNFSYVAYSYENNALHLTDKGTLVDDYFKLNDLPKLIPLPSNNISFLGKSFYIEINCKQYHYSVSSNQNEFLNDNITEKRERAVIQAQINNIPTNISIHTNQSLNHTAIYYFDHTLRETNRFELEYKEMSSWIPNKNPALLIRKMENILLLK